MNVLIDTHILLWAVDLPRRVPVPVIEIIEDSQDTVFFSAASIWEVAIKASLRKADFDADAAEVATAAIRIGFVELPITARVAALVSQLPLLHRDPFDRLLVTQALQLPAILLTVDRELEGYSELVKRFDPA
jgi:PIN domain nuclease of toxin-antitoxin system